MLVRAILLVVVVAVGVVVVVLYYCCLLNAWCLQFSCCACRDLYACYLESDQEKITSESMTSSIKIPDLFYVLPRCS